MQIVWKRVQMEKMQKKKSECEETKGKFTSIDSTVGTCIAPKKTKQGDCIAATANWTPATSGHCSVKGVTKELCQGTTKPTFIPGSGPSAGTCKFVDINITGKTTQSTCEVQLQIEDKGTCSNVGVKKEDCEKEPISFSLLLISLII